MRIQRTTLSDKRLCHFTLWVAFFCGLIPLNLTAAPQVRGTDKIKINDKKSIFGPKGDFLLDPSPYQAKIHCSRDRKELTIENGLIRRTWRLQPNGACIAFDNLMTGQSMLRAIRPEATLELNGQQIEIGGLIGQPNQAYLTREWLDQMKANPAAARLVEIQVGTPKQRIRWNRRRHASTQAKWPPKGISLELKFLVSKKDAKIDAIVSVHYELYDGIPALTKWLTVQNQSSETLTVDRFRAEELALVEQENWVELRGKVKYPRPDYLHVETDFAFGGFNHQNANRHTVTWQPDPKYTTQVNYLKKTPCLLTVAPTYGPSQEISSGKSFESFHVFELVFDRGDRERRGLTLRKMYRTLAPWVTENPITHHLLNSNPESVKQAIDQAAEVGFEAVILSFGSGFDMENETAKHLERWKSVADYAESKKIEIGAYSLFSSRKVGGGNDVKSPKGEKPTFGNAPAATSKWGRDYFAKLDRFFDKTGFDQFENDGPYPGDVDVTPRPPYQKGIDDSRWAQWKIVSQLFRNLRAKGVYINQPDYYFMVGGNKTGMGYREVNWSLPRAQQVIHTRQNIFDGTWTKTPSMGWMHVPLAQYHGGGPAATIEPLHKHLDHYETMLRSNLGMGVQAHYRGPRLYDTEETRIRVKSVVDWFKKYRAILESDIIHGRRADGQDLDWILHVNPTLPERGMLCVYNPLAKQTTRKLRVNLYYSGLHSKATVAEKDGTETVYQMDRLHEIEIEVTVPAKGMTWFVIRK